MNTVHATSNAGSAGLDSVVSEADQDAWLRNPSHVDLRGNPKARVALSDSQRARFSNTFAKFEKHPLASSVLALVQRYVDRCLIAPRLTEHEFWSVSCMPSTNRSSWPRLLSINAAVMELFVAGWLKPQPDVLWSFVNVAEHRLTDRWPSLNALVETYPYVEIDRRGYRDAGPDQVTLHVKGSDHMAELLGDECVATAAATLALHVMRKRATIYSRFHCAQLSNLILRS